MTSVSLLYPMSFTPNDSFRITIPSMTNDSNKMISLGFCHFRSDHEAVPVGTWLSCSAVFSWLT